MKDLVFPSIAWGGLLIAILGAWGVLRKPPAAKAWVLVVMGLILPIIHVASSFVFEWKDLKIQIQMMQEQKQALQKDIDNKKNELASLEKELDKIFDPLRNAHAHFGGQLASKDESSEITSIFEKFDKHFSLTELEKQGLSKSDSKKVRDYALSIFNLATQPIPSTTNIPATNNVQLEAPKNYPPRPVKNNEIRAEAGKKED